VAGPFIESLYPTSVFYIAVFSLVFGNFLYFYYYMIGAAKREQWEMVKYAFFVPFYWLMMSYGTWIALQQVISKPHYWEKTTHGLHLKNTTS
jgi:high-affinity Fe2+/Pb2+ permease